MEMLITQMLFSSCRSTSYEGRWLITWLIIARIAPRQPRLTRADWCPWGTRRAKVVAPTVWHTLPRWRMEHRISYVTSATIRVGQERVFHGLREKIQGFDVGTVASI